MKRLFRIITLSILFSLLMACGADTADTDSASEDVNEEEAVTEETEIEAGSFPLTLTDAMGDELTIEEEPERILTLIPSNTEIVFALDQGEKMVGVTDNDNYPEEVEEIEKIGGMEFNVEAMIALDPDIVLAHESGLGYAEEAFEQLKNAGIAVFVVEDAVNIEETYETIEVIGSILGAKAEANELVADMQAEFEELDELTAAVPEEERPSVFFEISPEPDVYTAGENTFLDELLTVINAENAMAGEEGWFAIDPEVIIETNPAIIISTYGDYVENAMEQIMERDGFEAVDAVVNERVYDLDSDKVTRPGPRLVDGARELAEAVYPELFEEE